MITSGEFVAILLVLRHEGDNTRRICNDHYPTLERTRTR